VVSQFVAGDLPRTKDAVQLLRAITAARRALVVVGSEDELTWKSLRNVPGVRVLEAGQLNTYDVVASDDVIFTENALAEFAARALPMSRQKEARP
jgi:large subunit ribosomal protein L4